MRVCEVDGQAGTGAGRVRVYYSHLCCSSTGSWHYRLPRSTPHTVTWPLTHTTQGCLHQVASERGHACSSCEVKEATYTTGPAPLPFSGRRLPLVASSPLSSILPHTSELIFKWTKLSQALVIFTPTLPEFFYIWEHRNRRAQTFGKQGDGAAEGTHSHTGKSRSATQRDAIITYKGDHTLVLGLAAAVLRGKRELQWQVQLSCWRTDLEKRHGLN